MRISFLASDSEKAQIALKSARNVIKSVSLEKADVVVAFGGDGFMLEVLKALPRTDMPVFGINQGTVGFLMNAPRPTEALVQRVEQACKQYISPLDATITTTEGRVYGRLAVNDVSLLRQNSQAANLEIQVDGTVQLDRLMADGIVLSTPAGSTAYNFSANGPILPMGANVLALTPLAAFRPRRWRGAVLPDTALITIKNLDPKKRPILVSADGDSIKDVSRVDISLRKDIRHVLLFDKDSNLEQRILAEQFC